MKDSTPFMSLNYYQLLQIASDADKTEIRRAYRQLARQYHPDVNGAESAKERFQEVTKAYETLSDTDARKKYDALIMTQSILDPTMFVQADMPILKLSLSLTMEQAYIGGKYTLRSIVSSTKHPCTRCKGKGVYIDTSSGFPSTTKCACQEPKEIKVKVDVPPKIKPETILSGTTRFKIPYKDIQVHITVQANPNFVYDGDIFYTLPINVFELMTGSQVVIPTFAGKESITIPPMTQPEEILVLEEITPIKIKFAPYLPKLSKEQIKTLDTITYSN